VGSASSRKGSGLFPPLVLTSSDSPSTDKNQIQQQAFMKLNAIDAAARPEDLRLPPSNRLEVLKGDRKGAYRIRINDQWRICFLWRDGHAGRVEIVDYH
jgi:proteic killer suppression protein